MSDIPSLVSRALQGCAAAVGPLIGVDLELGEVTSEARAEPPEGALGVLPLELSGGPAGWAELASPLAELALLARRMLGDAKPDDERALSREELDALGKLLTLMGGALHGALEPVVGDGEVLTWWRTDEPGERSLGAGEDIVLSRGELRLPDGQTVAVYLRLPSALLQADAAEQAGAGSVVLLGLPEDACASLSAALEASGLEVRTGAPDDPELAPELARARAVLLSDAAPGALDTVLQLATDRQTWFVPLILCAADPTEASVIAALEHGASHVLRLPAEPADVLRVLERSQPRG